MAGMPEESNLSPFARKLEAAREAAGISKRAAATLAGVSAPTYYNWINGTTVPDEDKQAAVLSRFANGEQVEAADSADGVDDCYADEPETETGDIAPDAPRYVEPMVPDVMLPAECPPLPPEMMIEPEVKPEAPATPARLFWRQ